MNSVLPHAGFLLNTLNAQTKTLVGRMSVPPPSGTVAAINRAIGSLVTAGYWARMAALYVPKKASAQQAALLDWKRSTKAATIAGSATWVQADGFYGSSTAGSYVNTDFIPSTDGASIYTLNDASMGAIVTSAFSDATLRAYFGAIGSGGDYVKYATQNNTTTTHINSNAPMGDADAVVAGLAVVQRAASNSHQIYMSGTQTGTGFTGSTALPNRTVYLLANNNNGTTQDMLPAKIGMWYAGSSFTGAEQLAI